MRTSIDILNYFRRRKQRKEIAKLKQELRIVQKNNTYYRMKCTTLERELDARKPFRKMYNDLINVLENVDRYCALRPMTKMHAPYPLRRFDVGDIPMGFGIMRDYHCINLYTAEILIQDYKVEECIHFELDTGDGVYRYQYSKEGLAVQTPARILEKVTQMMASAWLKKIHN